jgi:hydrogenase nickel insertion protein HypA
MSDMLCLKTRKTHMHELSIAQGLFKVILQEAKKNDIGSIARIIIRIGEASGLEEGFLRHSFVDHILPGTIAEKAKVEILPEALELKCKDCGKKLKGENKPAMKCCYCGSLNLEITGGMNVYVAGIEGE